MATMKTLNGYGFDSAKLGGKAPEYYLQPRNLLDNGDFTNPVNQRGATSVSDQYVYFIDRWITRDSGATYSIDKNGLKIDATNLATNATIRQVLPTTLKDGKYTVAVYRTDGSLKGFRVYNVIDTTLTRIDSVLNDADFYADLAYSGTNYHVQIMAIAGKAATFGAVSLYEGSYTTDTLPPYVPKGYAAELAECQRYYYRIPTSGARMSYVGYTAGTNTVRITIPTPVPMRTTPSLVFPDGSVNLSVYTQSGTVGVSSAQVARSQSCATTIEATTTSTVAEWVMCAARFNVDAALSAEP